MSRKPLSGYTVLLAEDEEVARGVLREVLRLHGCAVLVASSGEEALRLCQEHPGRVDLLITDVRMPGMHGPELARKVSRLRPGIRILYTSGDAEADLIEEGQLARGAPFMCKPFSLAELREVLGGGPAT